MKFLSSVLVALSAAAAVSAQEMAPNATQFAEGLLGALRQNNLSALADAVQQNAEALLPALLSSGNKTVFAPSNQALAAVGNVNGDALVATLAYHVVNGTVSVGEIEATSKSIYQTALNSSDFVNLPANRSQVVVLSKQEGNNTVYIQQAGRNVSFAATEDGPSFMNIRVQPIDQVLMVPGPTSEIAGALGASQLATLLQGANLVEPLDASRVTVFAPTNEAIMMVQDAIGAATPEQQSAVLLNHVLNGTVVYSTQLADTPSAISGSGQELRFMANDTGAYVMSGNVTARIVMSDYAAENGVVHVIDQVLVNTASNTQAAESAFNSATQAAATSMPTPSGVGGANGGSSEGGNNENSATGVKVGAGAAALAVLSSAMWLLA